MDVPEAWYDDRFKRGAAATERTGPTHHVTLALSHGRPAVYSNALMEAAFGGRADMDVDVVALSPPLSLPATLADLYH